MDSQFRLHKRALGNYLAAEQLKAFRIPECHIEPGLLTLRSPADANPVDELHLFGAVQ